MKIGILTLKFYDNYGGIIQAFALKKTLEKLGHQVIFFEHIFTPKRLPLKIRYLIYLKRFILKFLLKRNIVIKQDKYILDSYLSRNFAIRKFIVKYIQREYIKIEDEKLSCIDAIVVGSDQVWRPIYAKPIGKFFLDFLDGNNNICKIAYAVSFGGYDWEFTQEEEKECARLAKQFDLITVREDSGIDLCKKFLGVNSKHVLDPTMLLEKDDYIQIIEKEQTPKSKGNLFAYVLDNSSAKQRYINDIAKLKGLRPFSIMLSSEQYDKEIPADGIDVWLRAFVDAEFVVTDSFHGCVFSIIFNKSFIVICNERRGKARFESLLKLFDLTDRLVSLDNLILCDTFSDINWNIVNSKIKIMKNNSLEILQKKLNENNKYGNR